MLVLIKRVTIATFCFLALAHFVRAQEQTESLTTLLGTSIEAEVCRREGRLGRSTYEPLCVGRLLERQGRLDDALTWYERALDSDSIVVRRVALDAVLNLETKRNSFVHRYLISPATTTLELVLEIAVRLGVLLVLLGLIYLALRSFAVRKTAGRYQISEVIDATQQQLGWGLGFLVEEFIEDAKVYYSSRVWNFDSKGLVLWSGSKYFSPEVIGKIVSSGGSDTAGMLVERLIKRLFTPEFTVESQVNLINGRCFVHVTVRQRGQIIQQSVYSAPVSSYPECREQLAYQIAVDFTLGVARRMV